MKKQFILPLVAGLCLFLPAILVAGQDGFQTTSQEMVKALTRQPVKYRSFAMPKKRSIVVIEKKHQIAQKTTIYIDESADVPKVKTQIQFDYNSAQLRSSSYMLLNEVGVALNAPQLGQQQILISGHTDKDGTDEYNLNLSFKRADAVKNYLVGACNVPESRLRVRGYGETLPLKPNTTGQNKQLNRRVEFEMIQ